MKATIIVLIFALCLADSYKRPNGFKWVKRLATTERAKTNDTPVGFYIHDFLQNYFSGQKAYI